MPYVSRVIRQFQNDKQ